MSYQVLARKWRPHDFQTLVGQEHVRRALVNALGEGRLHHAYLFTGTRGVGKTTIARILAKCLNCETGPTAQPCGVCSACRELDEGRFADLIEVDAASRTRVEDTRELLDNVQYAPTHGRFKVYLIDEVHMLSGHSFNALLKTLEEPPEHVKFLLATTDPQKLPVTVVSRCLQFNLKRLAPAVIADHLQTVVTAEGVTAEAEAIRMLAAAADGSIRDGLSLLDQAIAFGGGQLNAAEVGDMLGTVAGGQLLQLLQALADNDGRTLLRLVAQLAERALDFADVLAQLSRQLYRLALLQTLPDALETDADYAGLQQLAAALSPEVVQLYYQIALNGQRDLPLAPDPQMGFEMVLLRMLAFQPVASVEPGPVSETPQRNLTTAGQPTPPAAAPRAVTASQVPAAEPTLAARVPSPAEQSPPAAAKAPAATGNEAAPAVTQAPAAGTVEPAELDWEAVMRQLGLRGPSFVMASHCYLLSRGEDTWRLALAADYQSLRTPRAEEQLRNALTAYLGRSIDVKIEVLPATASAPDTNGNAGSIAKAAPSSAVVSPPETPAQANERRSRERQQAAQQAIEGDDLLQQFMHTFDAEIVKETIQPLGSSKSAATGGDKE